MKEPFEQTKYRGFNINFYYDNEDPRDPREDGDNFGTMICFHRNYTLGDEHRFSRDTLKSELAEEAWPDPGSVLWPTVEDTIEYWNNEGYEKALKNLGIDDGYGLTRKDLKIHEKAAEYTDIQINKFIDNILDQFYIILPLSLYDHSGISMSTTGFQSGWDSGDIGIIYVTKKKAKKEYGKDFEQKAINFMKAEVKEYDHYISGECYGYDITPMDANKKIECDGACWGFLGWDSARKEMLSNAKSEIDQAIKRYRIETITQIVTERKIRFDMNSFFNSCWAY